MRQGISFCTTLLLMLLIFGGWSCASLPPVSEYTIARVALEAAREVEAVRYAPGFWHKAEEYYRKGGTAYRQNDFDVARKLFKRAITFAEKAENSTRLRKFQSGEGIP